MLACEESIVIAGLQLFFVPYFSSTKLKMSFAGNHKPSLPASPETFKRLQCHRLKKNWRHDK